jgi:hypothetical protein
MLQACVWSLDTRNLQPDGHDFVFMMNLWTSVLSTGAISSLF